MEEIALAITNSLVQMLVFVGLASLVLLAAAGLIAIMYRINSRREAALVESALKECGLE